MQENPDGTAKVLSNVISSQIKEHEKFGGVVPEIAARSHAENIDFIVGKALNEGKKDLKEGVIIIISSKDEKVGIAVGVTNKYTEKYDAVKFVNVGSKILGGNGGGGRRDFAQAGGSDESKINETFDKYKTLINNDIDLYIKNLHNIPN